MSYYRYVASSYQSSMPARYRSSSVERTFTSSSGATRFASGNPYFGSGRHFRATTAPPGDLGDASYYGVMPFNRSLGVIDEAIRARAASVAPVGTYARAYTSVSPYGATSFDYKVRDYASRLDNEESTRSYINSLRSDYRARSSAGAIGLDNPFSTYGAAFGRASSMDSDAAYESRVRNRLGNLDSYRVSNRDLYAYKHYRKSNQTLEERNTRAQSPMNSREIDRYFKTERRASYMGDISSGGHRDFRYYNYRHVPYYGGSDYYTLTQQVGRV